MSVALNYVPVLLTHPGRTAPVNLADYEAEATELAQRFEAAWWDQMDRLGSAAILNRFPIVIVATTPVADALAGLDDWGPAGTTDGQYRHDLVADRAALTSNALDMCAGATDAAATFSDPASTTADPGVGPVGTGS